MNESNSDKSYETNSEQWNKEIYDKDVYQTVIDWFRRGLTATYYPY